LITSSTYPASTAELQRRLRAYTTLIVSLLCGIVLSSIDYLIAAPAVWFIGVGGLALLLVLSRVALIRSLRNYAMLELRLDDTHIERVRGETVEKFAFADITRLRNVRTSRMSLRETTAKMRNGRRLSMNAVADFERFEQDLRSKLPANATITEAREPIDYDHPLFYVVFGLITGVAFTLAVRAMATLSQSGMKWTTLAIACYSAMLGAYVLLARPLSQRYGPRSRFGDFVLGLFALLAGILLAARSLFG
jgi:membrane protein YdbS with pleckstrin-like domain